MPRLILKCPYLKGSRGAVRRGNYLRYIATREGVELTQGEESLPGREGYLQYIAQRPHVQRVGQHGLFSASDKPISLSKAAEELSQHPGNVWTPILSLRREDAARLGYDHWEQWQALLRAHAPEVAEAMKIPFPDFRWYAAFHNEGHHPHVHMVCYSADASKGYLTKEGLAKMRSVLARDIFRQDLIEIYKRQTRRREDLVQESQTALRDAIRKIREGPSRSSGLEPLLLQLAEKLLQEYYDLDYIYPKYRGLVPISTIYEYLASGRCSTLTGPNGAYNLYEMELRMNTIIGKLDDIIVHLEDISYSQRMLYDKVKASNQRVENLLAAIENAASNIERNTAMDVYTIAKLPPAIQLTRAGL